MAVDKSDYLVDCVYLRKCAQWKTSALKDSFMFGGVTRKDLRTARTLLQAIDDRTPTEEEFLVAMNKTVADFFN